jgi:hypothetical protein
MITITITSRRELAQADKQRFIRWFEKRIDLGLEFGFQTGDAGNVVVAGLPRRGKRLAADCRQYHADLLA